MCVSLASIYSTMSHAVAVASTNGKTMFLWYGWFRIEMLQMLNENTESTFNYSLTTYMQSSVE